MLLFLRSYFYVFWWGLAEQGPTPKDMKKIGRNFEIYENSDTVRKPWNGHEKPVKTPWKGHAKPAKSGVCKKMQKNGFAILWPIFLMSAPALCGCCWSCGAEILFLSRYESFEAFSHLGPLL